MIGRQVIEVNRGLSLDELLQFMNENWDYCLIILTQHMWQQYNFDIVRAHVFKADDFRACAIFIAWITRFVVLFYIFCKEEIL